MRTQRQLFQLVFSYCALTAQPEWMPQVLVHSVSVLSSQTLLRSCVLCEMSSAFTSTNCSILFTSRHHCFNFFYIMEIWNSWKHLWLTITILHPAYPEYCNHVFCLRMNFPWGYLSEMLSRSKTEPPLSLTWTLSPVRQNHLSRSPGPCLQE